MEDHTEKHPLLYCANIYYGCQHNCQYCYSKKIYYWKRPWREAEPVDNALELAKKEVKRKETGRIMFCSMCDAYQLIERRLGLARRVLEVLVDSKFLILIMTKSDLVIRDYDIIQGHDNVEVGFTITSLNDIPMWEPEAPLQLHMELYNINPPIGEDAYTMHPLWFYLLIDSDALGNPYPALSQPPQRN